MTNAPYPIRGLGDWWNELRLYINDRPTDTKIVEDLTDPESDIREVLGATFATRNEVRVPAKMDGSDETDLIQGAIADLVAAGGGTLLLPASPIGAPIMVTNLVIPNDGATPAKQPVIILRGQGPHWSGRGSSPLGGTTLEFTEAADYGLLATNGLGLLGIQGITFRNTNPEISTPFIYTTNTTLHIVGNAFVGAKTGAACDQDAIVCGGTKNIEGQSGWDHGFQGYGTLVEGNFFSGIRRIVYGRTFFNANRIIGNTAWTTCGHSAGAAIELDGDAAGEASGSFAVGNVISDNLIEMPNYLYGIRLRYASRNTIRHNNLYDAHDATTQVGVMVEAVAQDNNVLEGFTDQRCAPLCDLAGTTTFAPSTAGVPTPIRAATYHRDFLLLQGKGGDGAMSVASSGERATLRAVTASGGYPRARVMSFPGITVADAETTSGSRTLTSATAGFTVADQGVIISGPGIQSATYITQVVSATTVLLSKAATATATGVTVTFPRVTSAAREEVEFSRGHWRALGSDPTAVVGAGSGGGSASVSGKDVAGRVTVTTGGSPTAGALCSWTPSINYNTVARVQITPRNAATAALLAGGYWISGTTSAQTLNTVAAPAASTAYEFDYLVVEA